MTETPKPAVPAKEPETPPHWAQQLTGKWRAKLRKGARTTVTSAAFGDDGTYAQAGSPSGKWQFEGLELVLTNSTGQVRRLQRRNERFYTTRDGSAVLYR